MIKKFLFMLTMLAIALPVAAEESGARSLDSDKKPVEAQALERDGVLRKERVGEAREEIKERRVEAREKIEVMREDFEKKRKEAKENVGIMRAKTQEKISAEREVVKARLLKVRDEKKRNTLERIEKELLRLNAHISEVLGKALNQIADVLGRVEERVEKARGSGQDVSAVTLAIETAYKAILTAQDAVKAQANKSYAIENLNDQTLRGDAKELKKMVKSDLRSVRELVKVARTAVRDVAVSLAQIPKSDNQAKVNETN